MTILLLIVVIVCVFFIITGHKYQIKRLWREIFNNALQVGKWRKVGEGIDIVISALQAKQDRAGKLINALLDYHYFHTENEEEIEYVNENRYESKKE